jgi:hypothetical protein
MCESLCSRPQLLQDAPVQAQRGRQLRHPSRRHDGFARARLFVKSQPGMERETRLSSINLRGDEILLNHRNSSRLFVTSYSTYVLFSAT